MNRKNKSICGRSRLHTLLCDCRGSSSTLSLWVIAILLVIIAYMAFSPAEKANEPTDNTRLQPQSVDTTPVQQPTDTPVDRDTPVTPSKENDKNDKEPSQEQSGKKDSGKVSPEFKEIMDSYEAFFDEYVAVMKAASNGSLEAVLKSTLVLEKYAVMIDSLEAIEEEELSAADAAYYAEACGRIFAKLMQVMQ